MTHRRVGVRIIGDVANHLATAFLHKDARRLAALSGCPSACEARNSRSCRAGYGELVHETELIPQFECGGLLYVAAKIPLQVCAGFEQRHFDPLPGQEQQLATSRFNHLGFLQFRQRCG